MFGLFKRNPLKRHDDLPPGWLRETRLPLKGFERNTLAERIERYLDKLGGRLHAGGDLYPDVREPLLMADVAAVTLSTTDKALYGSAAFPVMGVNFFKAGRMMHIIMFGKITTAATPGNLTIDVYFGTGADANGTIIASSAAQTLVASQTNISWRIELWIKCRTTGATGTLMCTGYAQFGTAVIAAGSFLIPASAAAATTVNTTAASIISVQAKRSGSTAETMAVQELLPFVV